MESQLGTRVLRKISLRIVPFIMLLYFVAFIDRVNIGFASLTMNKDIGLSPTVYGFGAGIFFWGYFLFEVPSNIILHKVGARIWIARVMITWGIVSAAMALVQGATSFYVLRFLLGAAEAGFFPGIILYLSYWFPARQRAAVTALFMAAAPLSTVLGSPLSGALLEMHGMLGFEGWQWLFVLEAVPRRAARLRGAGLPDRPAGAGEMACRRRARLAGQDHEGGERRQGRDRKPLHLARARRSARAGAGAGLFRHLGRALYARRVGAADHQAASACSSLPGRLPQRGAARPSP